MSADDLRCELQVLEDDVAELRQLQDSATRAGVHSVLRQGLEAKAQRMAEVEAALATLQKGTLPLGVPVEADADMAPAAPQPPQPAAPPQPPADEEMEPPQAVPEGVASFTPLGRYSWDQSDRFVKIYCDLPNLSQAQDCGCSFNLTSFTFWAAGVPGAAGRVVSHKLCIPQLCEKISNAGSSLIRKDGKFVVRLAKLSRGVEWSGLDDSEKRKQQEHKSLVDKGATTEELLANMYRNADDKTRSELSQAAHQGRVKRETDAKAKGLA
eukprot:TRINITY_DN34207_c0_g1_i1.p1 TRINITY_DN34207_c0_g1~~TRINITY_DN34207_c0_g1_i1.p1  ORF type:complete len:268 (+),score=121.10 TRINITY_DN34207_c0_g1_i1:44-847(+)